MAAAIVVVMGVAFAGRRAAGGLHRERAAAARQLGLGYRRLPAPRIAGRLEGLDVEVVVQPGRRADLVFSASPVAPGLALAPAGLFRTTGRVPTGDPAFDAAFDAEGAPTVVLANLGTETRLALLAALSHTALRVENGAAIVQLPGLRHDAAEIVATLERLVIVARHLAPGGDTKRHRLLVNATTDGAAGARRRNLEVLIDDHPAAPETRRACQQALVESDDAAVLLAAKALGADGRPALEGLALDTARDGEIRREAFSALEATAERDRLVVLAERLLDARDPALRRRALGILAKTQHRAAAPRIAALAARSVEREDDEKIAIAGALGALGDTVGEPALLALLRAGALPVRLAAASALATCGTIAAVEALRDGTHGLFVDRDLTVAADASIAAIQARAEGAAAGQVSLAEPGAEGHLSVAAPLGALTLKGRP